jgi:hypothetical protein
MYRYLINKNIVYFKYNKAYFHAITWTIDYSLISVVYVEIYLNLPKLLKVQCNNFNLQFLFYLRVLQLSSRN